MALRTMHEQGTMDAYQRFAETPGAAEVMMIAARNVADGTWDTEFLNAVGHTVAMTRTKQHQLFAVTVIHHNIMLGKVLRLKVRAGGSPQSDRGRDENARLLGDLPEPFTAQVDRHQVMGDEDGWFEWSLPVFGNRMTAEPEHGLADSMTLIDPRRVPLEIGSTTPSRTLLHLRQDRSVARWPYGTDWVTVYVADGELAKL